MKTKSIIVRLIVAFLFIFGGSIIDSNIVLSIILMSASIAIGYKFSDIILYGDTFKDTEI